MIGQTIYFDNAATTFPKPEAVYYAMDYANRNFAVNAGRGSYELARKATKLIDETRKKLRYLCSCEHADIVFSSSATAAINQILRGIQWFSGDVVYVSPYEHNAVMRTLHSLHKEKGIIIEQIAIDSLSLEVDLEKTEYLFTQRKPRMVCCTHVSNVTGYILPINDIAKIAKKYNALTFIDGAQALGLVPYVLNEDLIDFYVFAGHKTLYGPFGLAGFYYNKLIDLKDSFTGGTGSNSLDLDMPLELPAKYEAASPNIVAMAGFNAAIEILIDNVPELYSLEKELTSFLINELQTIPGIVLYLPMNLENHIGIISFNIPGYRSDDIGVILDQDFNIAARCGYHCAPLIHKHLCDQEYSGTVRVSIGRFTSKDSIVYLLNALKELIST